MNFAAISLLGLVFAAERHLQPAPDAADIRTCIERSLPFLEKAT